jgi:DNA-binding transcriptional ArsR family regulator
MPDHDFAQRAVLRVLLEAHPRMLGIDELAAQLADIPRVREALRVLTDDGLARKLGERVGVSRAAVRFDALADADPPGDQRTT